MRRSSRFIPAGAGNTRAALRSGISITVHPRRRGEHPCRWIAADSDSGSSPQARGTLEVSARIAGEGRFIPAGAGNTCELLSQCAAGTVHPRRRGEHMRFAVLRASLIGSSPQARGTPRSTIFRPRVWRFIPAGAGNTQSRILVFSSLSVHPRRRGEHVSTTSGSAYASGSSPQARGTLRHTTGAPRG